MELLFFYRRPHASHFCDTMGKLDREREGRASLAPPPGSSTCCYVVRTDKFDASYTFGFFDNSKPIVA